MSSWGVPDGSCKRKAEHTLSLQSKRHHLGDVNPGQEYVEPRVYQQPTYAGDPQHDQGTDFSSWSEAEIKVFLDERGGDFDDCTTFQQLVDRAVETEINTGPARRQQAAAASAAGGGTSAAQDAAAAVAGGAAGGDEDEYDPLEAFMAEVNQEVAANKPNKAAGGPEVQQCDDVADPAAEYMEVRAARGKTSAAAIAANVAAAGYDSDDEVYATAEALAAGQDDDDDSIAAKLAQKRNIDPLAPVDHSLIEYDDFAKDFYTEHPSIAGMTELQVRDLRRQLDIHVSGYDPPRPVKTFGQAGFDHLLLGAIKRAGYEAPTPIQAQALPAVLSGRDVLGLAKTGSGKTAAFVLPMLVHIMDQPELGKGEGPIGLVLAPTRELAEQIHKETRKFSKPYGLRCVAAFGGLSKFEQFKELKAGAEVAVATPGRMMDLIRMKACTTQRVTYLVLDEADRMFDMGFGEQVHSLLNVVRPDRQTLLFSATLPRKIEALVSSALTDPVRISVGLLGAANVDVAQHVEIMTDDAAKLSWLTERLPGFIDEGDVLCFVGQRAKAEELTQALVRAGFKAAAIHGDMDQFTRMQVLDAFRSGGQHVLVATDVAARGLDIKSIKSVINYDAARDIDTHIHRVGRTGRAGDKEGVAYSLLLAHKDAHFAGQLVNSLTLGGQAVPPDLHALAMKDGRFRRGNRRDKGGRGGGKGGRHNARGAAGGGAGLGFGGAGQSVPQSSAQAAAASAAAGAGHPPGGGAAAAAAAGAAAAAAARQGQPDSGGFVQLPGFAKSISDYEHESSAAATAPSHGAHRLQQQQQGGMPPPPPAGSSEAFSFPPPPPSPPRDGSDEQQPPLPPPEDEPAAPLPAAAAQHKPEPPAAAAPAAATAAATPAAAAAAAAAAAGPAAPPPGSMAAARQELLQAGYAVHMKRGFVSSGVRGGDIGEAATVVAPRAPKPASSSGTNSTTVTVVQLPSSAVTPAAAAVSAPPKASGRPVPPPPIPVTQRPMYLTRPTETITRGPRRPPQQQPPAAAMNSAAAQQAIAAAQAIAQRLAAQAGGTSAATGSNTTAVGGGYAPAAATPSYAGGPYQAYAQLGQQQQQQQQQYYQAGQPPAQQQQQQQQEYDPFQQGPAAPPQQLQAQAGAAGGAYDPVAAAQAVAARLAAQHPHR